MKFRRASLSIKGLCFFVSVAFIATLILADVYRVKDSVAQDNAIGVPAGLLTLSADYSAPLLKGLIIDPKNPLSLEFIVDSADSGKYDEESVKELVSYFLVALTVPQTDLWVNLSPYEKERVLPDSLQKTELGKTFLAQDYLLKQLSASLTYPDTELGKAYWLEALASDSFNKIWIKAEKAEIYEENGLALIKDSSLKVMSESDYLAMVKTELLEEGLDKKTELLLPQISQQVNSSKHFAKLRQLYSALILVTWFKDKLKDSFYKHYIDANKIDGQELNDTSFNQSIYDDYLHSVKDGVYEIIRKEEKEDGLVKKKYFSGGNSFIDLNEVMEISSSLQGMKEPIGSISSSIVDLEPLDVNSSLFSSEESEWPNLDGANSLQDLRLFYKEFSKKVKSVFNLFNTEKANLSELVKRDLALGDYLLFEITNSFGSYLSFLQMLESDYNNAVGISDLVKSEIDNAYQRLMDSVSERENYSTLPLLNQTKKQEKLDRDETAFFLKHYAFYVHENSEENFDQYRKMVDKVSELYQKLSELEEEQHQKNSSSALGEGGYGRMELKGERADYALELAMALEENGIEQNKALRLGETIASLRLGSINIRNGVKDNFFAAYSSDVFEGRINKGLMRHFMKSYNVQLGLYDNYRNAENQKVFSEEQIDKLLLDNLVPISWYKDLVQDSYSHEDAIEYFLEADNPISRWRHTFKNSINLPESLGISRANSIRLILAFDKNFISRWEQIQRVLRTIIEGDIDVADYDSAAKKLIDWGFGPEHLEQFEEFERINNNKIESLENVKQQFGIASSAIKKQIVFKNLVDQTDLLFDYKASLSYENTGRLYYSISNSDGEDFGKVVYGKKNKSYTVYDLEINEAADQSIIKTTINGFMQGSKGGSITFWLHSSQLDRYYTVLNDYDDIVNAKCFLGEYVEIPGRGYKFAEIEQYKSLSAAKKAISSKQHIRIEVKNVNGASSSVTKRDGEDKHLVLSVLNTDKRLARLVELEKKYALETDDGSFSVIEADLAAQTEAQRYLSGSIQTKTYISRLLKIFKRNNLTIDSAIANIKDVKGLGTIKMTEHWNSEDPQANSKSLINSFRKSLDKTVYPYLAEMGYDEVYQKIVIAKVNEFIDTFIESKVIQKMTIHEVDEIIVAALRGIIDADPYWFLKQEVRDNALEIAIKRVENIRLDTAVLFAAVGNSLDFANLDVAEKASKENFLDQFFDEILNFERSNGDILALTELLSNDKKNILYALDNAGEDVYDLLLIRELMQEGHKVTVVAKSLATVNDTTYDEFLNLLEDERAQYILGDYDKSLLEVVPSGSISYGTDLARISPQLKKSWRQADLLISKGQANYYTLRNANPTLPVFFLGKCKVALEMFDNYKKGDYFTEYMEYKLTAHEELSLIFNSALDNLYQAYELIHYAQEHPNASEAEDMNLQAVQLIAQTSAILRDDLKRTMDSEDKLMKLFFHTVDAAIVYHTLDGDDFDATFDIKNNLGKAEMWEEFYEDSPDMADMFLGKIQAQLDGNVLFALESLVDILSHYKEKTYESLDKAGFIIESEYGGRKKTVIDMHKAVASILDFDYTKQPIKEISSAVGGLDFADISVSSSGLSFPIELEGIDTELLKGFSFSIRSHKEIKDIKQLI